MTRRTPSLFCTIAFAAASTLAALHVAAGASLPPSTRLQVPPLKYEKYTLPNGLTVLLHEDHRLPLVAVDLWYHVGPVNETAGRTGFAHLFEHMMFEGSEHVGEKAHFKYLEGAGATDINGTTDFDRTNYFETLPSNEIETGLWLESDRMGFLLETLDRAKLTNQRDVVRNELRQDENQPYDVADEEIYHQLFPKNHPYHAAVIGSHADIEAARLLDVRDFFHDYYTPNNANLAIAGDFKTDELKALIVKYFGPIKRGPEAPPVEVVTPPITKEVSATVTDTVQLPRLSIAWLMPPAFQTGNADAILLNRILGEGKASRLYRSLVYDKQIAQSAACDMNSLKLGSVLQCDITGRPGATADQLRTAADQEIARLRSAGPTQAELDGARNQQLSQLIGGLERLGGFGGVADRMDLYNYYTGDPGYLPKDVARFQAVSIASMTQVAQATLGDNQRVIVTTLPGKKVTDDVPRSPDDTDAAVRITPPYDQAYEDQQSWRKSAPSPGPSPSIHLPVPAAFALPNGLSVYLVEDHSLPVLSAAIVTKAGGDTNPPGQPGLAAFTAAMLTEGTTSRPATLLADQVDGLGAQLQAASSADSSSATISGLSNTTAPSLDLLADVIQHPAFADAEVERVRKQRLVAILQEGDRPTQSTLRVGLRALYGDQPYGYRPIGTTDSVKAITRDQLAGFWKERIGPKNAALILVGDLTLKQAHDLAGTYFAGWSAPGVQAGATLPPPPPPPSRKVILVDKPGSPQTVLIAFGLGVPRTVPDYPSVVVMNDILGGLFSSRINMNLRENHGYTYGAFSEFAFYRAGGPLYAGAQVRTDVTAPAAKELFSELDRIRAVPATAPELKLARESELRSLPGHFETTRETTDNIAALFDYTLPADYYANLPGKFEAVTPQGVQQAADADIHPDQMILVAVGDRAKIETGLKQLNLGPIEIRDPMGNLVQPH